MSTLHTTTQLQTYALSLYVCASHNYKPTPSPCMSALHTTTNLRPLPACLRFTQLQTYALSLYVYASYNYTTTNQRPLPICLCFIQLHNYKPTPSPYMSMLHTTTQLQTNALSLYVYASYNYTTTNLRPLPICLCFIQLHNYKPTPSPYMSMLHTTTQLQTNAQLFFNMVCMCPSTSLGLSESSLTLHHCKAKIVVCLVSCLTSQQHAGVSQGQVCSDNFTCYHTEVKVAEQHQANQSEHSPLMPGAWQDSHRSANFQVTGTTRPRKILA